MKKTILFAIPFLLLLAAGCHKDPLSVKTETTALSFEAAGGTRTFDISSNGSWEIIKSEGADWLSVDPASGKGNARITLSASPYEDAGRTAILHLKGGTEFFASISVVQNGPALPSEPEEESIRLRAFEQDYLLPKVDGYVCKLTLGEEADGIATLTGEAEGVFTLHFSENSTDDGREFSARIETSDGGLLKTVKFVQSWRNLEPGELLIDEIYFSGSLPEGGTSSIGDQYFRLTNATAETLYADGLMIASGVSHSQSTSWVYPTLTDSIGVSTLYLIPGSGKDVKLEAGESLIIAISASDYSANGGCNLSGADFEFYDENDIYPDTDNPDVDDLTNWFKASNTITTIHQRGFESWAIAIAPRSISAESFMAAYAWVGTRTMDFNGHHFEKEIKDAYLIPNEWVIDGVNLAIPEDLGTLWFNASIDAGYTNNSTVFNDPERFGKAVRRKALADTNNSTNDFEIVTPSLK